MMSYIRERWALLVIALGGVYAVHTFFATPAIDRRAQVTAEAEAAGEELDAASSNIVTAGPDRSTERIARLLELRFGDDAPIGEQNQIHSLANEAGLRIENVDPDANPSDDEYGPFRLRSRQIRVAAVGSYDQIATFLSAMDASPMAVLEEVSVRRADGSDEARVSLSVRVARIEVANRTIADGGAQ